MIFYMLWIPSVIIFYGLTTYFTKLNNEVNSHWIWFVLLCIPIPCWAIVSKYSKNLIFDGLLYDIIMMLTYVIIMCLLNAGDSFTYKQWIGVIIVMIGFILIKLG